MARLVVLMSILVAAARGSVDILSPPVQTQYGPVQGSANKKLGITTYHSIPFAKPPLGDLRWKPPVAATPWWNPKKTVSPAPPCTQMDLIKGEHTGDEDCLYISA